MSIKNAYIEKLQARLNEMDAEIESLKSQASVAKADAKIEYEKQIKELQDTQAQAQEKLDEMRNASDDAWQDMKFGVERAWEEFEHATKRAIDRFAA